MGETAQKKFLIQKVVAGDVGPAGPAGPAGPEGTVTLPIPSSGVSHDGLERNGELVNVLLDELLYVLITISAFTNTINNQEKGVTINSVGLNWTLNKSSVVSQLITGTLISPTDPGVAARSFTLNGALALSTAGIWNLAVNDGTNLVNKTTAINFFNRIHWGAAPVPGSINDAFVLSLFNSLQSGRTTSFAVTAGVDDKIWFALPSAYGTPLFTVGGFVGGFSLTTTFSHTNASGFSENYDVWESDSFNLGITTVNIT